MPSDQVSLFEEERPLHARRNPQQQDLFVFSALTNSKNDVINSRGFEEAHKVILKWADLESNGKLHAMKETALEAEFISDVFGKALGYQLFSDHTDAWQLERKVSLPGGGELDVAIGRFSAESDRQIQAVIELKGPSNNLDRDRSNGRTAVQQCWDYLNALPGCPWGIVSNIVSFRIYHRSRSNRTYQPFTLQDLRDRDTFGRFYALFSVRGLLSVGGETPIAERTLQKSTEWQEEIGDKLYDKYDNLRRRIIEHVTLDKNKSLETATRIAQVLLDRIIFIAFCEDRELLPEKILERTSKVPFISEYTNPRWRQFRALFLAVDKGKEELNINAFNGSLFALDIDRTEVDSIELDDALTAEFQQFGVYNYRDEVSVEVLGHIFERSIKDVADIKRTGLFGERSLPDPSPQMKKIPVRKRGGVYYTPKEFTKLIVERTVTELLNQRFAEVAARLGVAPERRYDSVPSAEILHYWNECLTILHDFKVVDPACGSGAFLIAAYDELEEHYRAVVDGIEFHSQQPQDDLRESISDCILQHNLYGVDLSKEAVEIAQLSLWIRTARIGKKLSTLSENIVYGNSLVDDPAVDPAAFRWEERFPAVFQREQSGFDCVIGNPPWERLKLQEREFFDATDLLTETNAAKRKQIIEELATSNPDLYQRFQTAQQQAQVVSQYIRNCGRYPLTGTGDVNTYSVFAELANRLVAPNGNVGLLLPSGIVTDHTTRNFFATMMDEQRLHAVFDFENKKFVFADVDGRFKFCAFFFGGTNQHCKTVDFAFFLHHTEELENKKRHIRLSSDDIRLLNPNTRTCPIFRSQHDAEITKTIYRRVPVLIDHARGDAGNPWGIRFFTMFHQMNDANKFLTPEQLKQQKAVRDGAGWKQGKTTYLPLYEAKMIQMYDHRAAGVVSKTSNWMRQGQTVSTNVMQYQNADYTPDPRWWVEKSQVDALFEDTPPALLAFKDITSATNQRTFIASFIPYSSVIHTAPLIFTNQSLELDCSLLGNLNSIVFDFVVRQKLGGLHLTYFIIEQLPVFPPSFYDQPAPWARSQKLVDWISERVLKLSCTSTHLIPLARATGFTPEVHPWNPLERAELMAELDAAYFLLYNLPRDDVEYVLSTFEAYLTASEEGEVLISAETKRDRILRHYDSLYRAASS